MGGIINRAIDTRSGRFGASKEINEKDIPHWELHTSGVA
jgi:hypothetical protein